MDLPPRTIKWLDSDSDIPNAEKVKYSPLEQKILEAIPTDGSMISTLELASKVYDAGDSPRYARQSVLHTANCLIQKSDDNQEPWEIFKSDSKPAYFWIKPRENKGAA